MAKKKSTAVLEVGWAIAVVMERPIGTGYCHVGEVQAIDERGFRITLMDWVVGQFIHDDFYIPWSNVRGMSICTDDHDFGLWSKDIGDYQKRINEARRDGREVNVVGRVFEILGEANSHTRGGDEDTGA